MHKHDVDPHHGQTAHDYGVQRLKQLVEEAKPRYVHVVDVTYFWTQGDPDDTAAIERAISYAKTGIKPDGTKYNGPRPVPIYFPAGTYVVSHPLEIDGCHVIGEPPSKLNETGTIIRASADFSAGNFNERPAPFGGLPVLSVAASRSVDQKGDTATRLFGLTLDAADVADHGLLVIGADTVLVEFVGVTNARRNAFIVNASNATMARLSSDQTGSSAMRSIRSRLRLSAFNFQEYRSPTGIHVEGDYPAGSEGAGLSGQFAIADGRLKTSGWVTVGRPSAGDLQLEDVHAGSISGIDVEGLGKPLVLNDAHRVIITSCALATSDEVEPIIKLEGGSSANLVADNVGSSGGNRPNIEIDPGCAGNHIMDNGVMGSPGTGLAVRYPGANDELPTDRNHLLGQEQFITMSREAPSAGANHADWEEGDIVFNAQPALGKPVGWIFVANSEQPGFRSLGPIYKDDPPTGAPQQSAQSGTTGKPSTTSAPSIQSLIRDVTGKAMP